MTELITMLTDSKNKRSVTRDRTERGLGTRNRLFQERAKIRKQTLKIKRAYALELRRESREAKTGVCINSIVSLIALNC